MKEMIVPIDGAGRVVLPKEIRDELAIEPGDSLKVTVNGNAVLLRRKAERCGFVRKGKALVFSTGGSSALSRELVQATLAETREESFARMMGGLKASKTRR